MTDAISLFMFAVPLMTGVIFFAISLAELKKDSYGNRNWIAGLIGSVLGMPAWIVFGLVWPAFATQAVMVSWAYLWFGIGVTCGVLAIFYGVQPMLAAARAADARSQPMLSLREQEDEDF